MNDIFNALNLGIMKLLFVPFGFIILYNGVVKFLSEHD